MVGPVVGPVYGFKPLLCTLSPVNYRDLSCSSLLWLETSREGLIAENACNDCVLDLIVTGRWARWWALSADPFVCCLGEVPGIAWKLSEVLPEVPHVGFMLPVAVLVNHPVFVDLELLGQDAFTVFPNAEAQPKPLFFTIL